VTAETIGERLRRLRVAAGFSQRDLAAPGVSYAYISRIEAGTRRPSVKALRRLAERLDVTPLLLELGTDEITCPHCGRQPSPSTNPTDPREVGERGDTRVSHHHP
jgi:transcriptional regulator with XRE-family HTH domain